MSNKTEKSDKQVINQPAGNEEVANKADWLDIMTKHQAPDGTSLEIKDEWGQPIGVTFHGYHSDSPEWKAAQDKERRNSESGGKQTVILKDKEQHIEIDQSQAAIQRRLLIQSITRIDPDPQGRFTPETRDQFFDNPRTGPMLDQWQAHINDRKNYMNRAENAA